MRRGHRVIAALAALAIAGPVEARKKTVPPPLPTDTLIENVNGYTLDSGGVLRRFNGLLIDEKGRVKQLLNPGDKREPVKFRTDAKGRTLLPGLIQANGRVMELGWQALQGSPAIANINRPRENPVIREAVLARAVERLASAGVTMVEDAGTTLDDWLLYRRFGDDGRLGVRIHAMAGGMAVIEHVAPLKPTPWLYDDRLAMRSVLLQGDEAAAPSAAAEAQLRNRISRASMVGIQAAVSVTQPAALQRAVDAYAEMLPTYGRDRRYRIETSLTPAPSDLKRIDEMRVVLSRHPADASSPLEAMQQAVSEGLEPAQALRAFTMGPAYAAFAEDRVGTLETAKWADFILVDRDVLAKPSASVPPPQVEETWVGGRRVFVKSP